jgi:hypothetical protein
LSTQRLYNNPQTSELSKIFADAPPNPFDTTVSAPTAVRSAYLKAVNPDGSTTEQVEVEAVGLVQKRLPEEDDDCPICCEGMDADGKGKNELVYDLGLGGCGKREFEMPVW